MLEKTPQQKAERKEASPAKNNNHITVAASMTNNRTASAEAKETQPVYQTYIYRGYGGGGYQGL